MDLPDLRPLSFGELLDRTFTYYRRHFLLFVGIMAVPQALIVAMNVVLQAFRGSSAAAVVPGAKVPLPSLPSPTFIAGMVFGFLIVMGAYFVVYSVALGATTFAVSEIHLGHPITARAAYGKLRGRYWRLLDLIVTVAIRGVLAFMIIMFGVIAIAGVAGFLVSVIPTGPLLRGLLGMVIGLLAILGLIAGTVLGVWYFLRYACGIPALLLENLKAGPAIRRSVALTKDNVGRVFVVGLLMTLVSWAVAAILQGPFMVAGFISVFRSHAVLPLWVNVASIFAGGVGHAITGPLLMIGMVLLYYDIRVRKEGFDLQLMMSTLEEQSPVATPAEDYLLPVAPPLTETNILVPIILTILTCGLYVPIWFLQKRSGVNQLHSNEKLGAGPSVAVLFLDLLTVLVNMGVGNQVPFIRNFETMWAPPFNALAGLAIGILMVMQAFKVRSIMEAHTRVHSPGPLAGSIAMLQGSSFSVPATFFLGIFYLQYKINELVEAWPQSQPKMGTDAVPAL